MRTQYWNLDHNGEKRTVTIVVEKNNTVVVPLDVLEQMLTDLGWEKGKAPANDEATA